MITARQMAARAILENLAYQSDLWGSWTDAEWRAIWQHLTDEAAGVAT